MFTGRILGADEDVGGLGQPLHELSNALGVVLDVAQRAHHGAQDATDDACEELRVEGFGRSGGVGSGGGSGGLSWGGTSRWRVGGVEGRWREDGLGGLGRKQSQGGRI